MVSAFSVTASKGSHAELWLPPQITVKLTRSDGKLLNKPPGSHSWRKELIWDHRFGHVTVVAPLWDFNASLICAYVEGAFRAAGATQWLCRVWMSPSQWQAVSAGLSTSVTGRKSEVGGLFLSVPAPPAALQPLPSFWVPPGLMANGIPPRPSKHHRQIYAYTAASLQTHTVTQKRLRWMV